MVSMAALRRHDIRATADVTGSCCLVDVEEVEELFFK
jgi:hypothetical protein